MLEEPRSGVHSESDEIDGTRARLLAVAKRQFASYGFYGASLSGIAGEIGLTKQALIYHFRRKEDVYSEVLRAISERLSDHVDGIVAGSDDPLEQLEGILLGLLEMGRNDPEERILLMREILDNRSRARDARTWYLADFLKTLAGLLQQAAGPRQVSASQARVLTYQLLGSIEYFLVSDETLKAVFGGEAFLAMQADFPGELRRLIRNALTLP
ncbi:TetR/AcrR family transcriptional regulator [Nitratireductor mangrovi]|uniref:TetR/AcrR family transcriptional regulator n=1 Tax=Nitratireductor mangrovi TaxID=2599600 RepID=A0A5B8KW07_9HYPH|nr:TetR/AcrR family transcriptional regulator [Nitratireductor mangrovi]QDY99708.1 TetR/AcrR family transcriptional regulator [Nitratireductor mangrovi]